MSTDNPVMETANVFYKESETADLTETTDNADVTEPETQEPAQDEKSLDTPEEVISEELESKDDEKESQFVEIDGKEIDLKDIKQWRDNGLMQSDYTKKTTEHAQFSKKERAELALDRENLTKAREEISTLQDKLTVLVTEDASIDWAELKEDDPEEYIKLKEKADERKAALEKVKAERETPSDDPALIQQESALFWKAHPEWVDKDNNRTEVFKEDAALMDAYISSAGFSSEEFNKITSSRQLETILKAAKYDQLQEKGNKIREKRTVVPVVTKPKAKTQIQSKSMADTFYGSTG